MTWQKKIYMNKIVKKKLRDNLILIILYEQKWIYFRIDYANFYYMYFTYIVIYTWYVSQI